MIQACLPTCRTLANPYCSNSSTVALNRNRPGASRPAVTSEIASTRPPPAAAIWASAPSSPALATPRPRWPLVDEDAGDPPARRRRRVLRVLTGVLQPELLPGAVLAPALREVILVEDQRRMRAASPDQLLLQSAGIADAALVLGVMRDAPAPSVDAVVALDEVGKGVPRRCVERTGLVGSARGRAHLSGYLCRTLRHRVLQPGA